MNAHIEGVRMQNPERDRGVMLPIVLVVTVVMSLAVIAIANYVSTDLSYGRVTVDRANRLAAADAVMNYGIDQLKLRNAGCLLGGGSTSLPGLNSPVNGASTSLTCQRVGGGIGDIQAWAAVMTGIGVPTNGSNAFLLST
jgi:Tfp pilus assembly protein PilX